MSDSKNTGETSGGNTTRGRHWCLTINNYTQEHIDLLQLCDKYTFQEELGSKNTRHLQCYVGWNHQRSFNAMKKKFPTAHIEKCKSIYASRKYCQKMKTRNGKIWTNIQTKEDLEDDLLEYELKDWQKHILDLIEKKPDKRKIHWFYEEKGGAGKTTLQKHISIHNQLAIGVSGAASDVKYAITEMKAAPKIVMWNLSRTQEGYVSYSGMEQVKDGYFFNTKYKCKQVIFNTPHVLVFANFEPDRTKLSADRWDVHVIH